ncbi:MAG: aminotransferase class IV [Bacteroidales bacterium]
MQYIETIKIENGKCCNWPYHLQRMQSICGENFILNLEIPISAGFNKVKCRIVYDPYQIIEITYTPYILPTIRSLKIIESPLLQYDHKYADRSEINNLKEQRKNCDDILICQHGAVCDSSFSNVVFENKEGFFTPRTALLYGTKRQILLDTKRIQEIRINLDDLPKYERIYLINAMLELEDAICIETAAITY